MTADMTIMPVRRRDLRHAAAGRLALTSHLPPTDVGGFEITGDKVGVRLPICVPDPALTWKDIEWLVHHGCGGRTGDEALDA